ncbi:hypothetical protein V1477_009952 [Vespula maculifrons]|uniref:Uncharacterized protein n=1 Tax=Vespula maculifrons TaxID=7453 RepID=A0ABD2CDF9_VESMC
MERNMQDIVQDINVQNITVTIIFILTGTNFAVSISQKKITRKIVDHYLLDTLNNSNSLYEVETSESILISIVFEQTN